MGRGGRTLERTDAGGGGGEPGENVGMGVCGGVVREMDGKKVKELGELEEENE